MRTKIKILFKKLPTYKIQVIFTVPYKMGNMFRFKDRLPESISSCVVYFFKCSSCNATYVGQTRRHQKVRFSEHAGISARTGKSLKPTLVNASSIKEHAIRNQHKVEINNDFTILSKGGNLNHLEIKESIMINKLRPSLNDNIISRELFLFN